MFDIQNYTSFVLAVLVFQLIPGAGTIAIRNATARNGAAAGMAAVAGTLAGDFVFMAAAAAGLAAVMRANCDGPIGCFCSLGLSLGDWGFSRPFNLPKSSAE